MMEMRNYCLVGFDKLSSHFNQTQNLKLSRYALLGRSKRCGVDMLTLDV